MGVSPSPTFAHSNPIALNSPEYAATVPPPLLFSKPSTGLSPCAAMAKTRNEKSARAPSQELPADMVDKKRKRDAS